MHNMSTMTKDALYDQVLTALSDQLTDGQWRTVKELLAAVPPELCDACLKLTSQVAWCDLENPHEFAWAAFRRDVLPKLLDLDGCEHRDVNGQTEVRRVVSLAVPAIEAAVAQVVDAPILPTAAAEQPISALDARLAWYDFDRRYEEFKAEQARDALEAAARKDQPKPVVPIPTISLAENLAPDTVAETLVRFYGVARARQIREGLVNKLRVFKNRKSASWDLVQDDFIDTQPLQIE
jgi:hypothetical protein